MAFRPVLALCAVLLLAASVACGGGGDSSPEPTSEPVATPTEAPTTVPTSAVSNSFEPDLSAPVSRFAVHQPDLGKGYLTDVQRTFELTAEDYAGTTLFADPAEGIKLLNEWGYRQGYETSYQPEGYAQAVLNGSYYISVEVHLFSSVEGAQQAFDFFEDRLATTSANVTAEPIGNQSSAWRLTSGTVQGSTVQGAYHRIISRRGNLVSVVMTWGADPFMTVDHVLNWARVVDAKAVGDRETIEPTPSGAASATQ